MEYNKNYNFAEWLQLCFLLGNKIQYTIGLQHEMEIPESNIITDPQYYWFTWHRTFL
jgi:hypothetical protein